jgi:hypothetical protein
VPALKDTNDSECWNAVFAETLQYRKTRSFNYMIDRTLYRPREIIQFCTDCIESSRKHKVQPIDYSMISIAELDYSNAREKDIAAEYRFQYPGLESVFEVFRGLTYTLERKELESICLGICVGESKVSQEAKWVLEQGSRLLDRPVMAYRVSEGVRRRRPEGVEAQWQFIPRAAPSLNTQSEDDFTFSGASHVPLGTWYEGTQARSSRRGMNIACR